MKELISLVQDYGKFHFELTYSSICDWMIRIYKSKCNDNGKDLIIFEDQNIDCLYLISKAEVALKDWLIENNGGY